MTTSPSAAVASPPAEPQTLLNARVHAYSADQMSDSVRPQMEMASPPQPRFWSPALRLMRRRGGLRGRAVRSGGGEAVASGTGHRAGLREARRGGGAPLAGGPSMRGAPLGWTADTPGRNYFPGRRRESASGNFAKEAARGTESRNSNPVFLLLRHGPAGSSPTAGNADRAVPVDFRRFPAVIWAFGDPLVRHRPRRPDHPVAV